MFEEFMTELRQDIHKGMEEWILKPPRFSSTIINFFMLIVMFLGVFVIPTLIIDYLICLFI
jgi:hypothetical protein